MNIDIVVVLVYFVFLFGIGWMFRSASANTSEYFRGGGRMLWWMVGSTAFMMALSAMTFTGLMGKALTSGMSVAMYFLLMHWVIFVTIYSLLLKQDKCVLLALFKG